MTGYESKRAAARDKLVDDRRAYYEKFDDLYAVYLNGVYDGKKAAQPAQERKALKLALKVLEDLPGFRADIDNAITVIKEVLEKTHEN
jgi:hypothetical protein